MTETELMEEIRTLCGDLRLLAFHVCDSRRSWGPGYPDLTIAGPRGLLHRECKGDDAPGPTPEQRKWGSVINQGGGNWAVWRPRDWRDWTIRRQLLAISKYAACLDSTCPQFPHYYETEPRGAA